MVDSRVPSLPSTTSTLAERLDCSSSSSAIVGKFAEVFIPLNAEEEAKETSDMG